MNQDGEKGGGRIDATAVGIRCDSAEACSTNYRKMTGSELFGAELMIIAGR